MTMVNSRARSTCSIFWFATATRRSASSTRCAATDCAEAPSFSAPRWRSSAAVDEGLRPCSRVFRLS
jgi:hypothetical protein